MKIHIGVFIFYGNFPSTHAYAAFKDHQHITLESYVGINQDFFNKVFVTPFKSIPNSTAKWEVTKLYKKDLRLKLVTDTGEYRIFFTKL